MSAQPEKNRDLARVDLKRSPDVRAIINEYMNHHHCKEAEAIRELVRKAHALGKKEHIMNYFIEKAQHKEDNEWKALPDCAWRTHLKDGHFCRNKKIRKIIDTERLDTRACQLCNQQRMLENGVIEQEVTTQKPPKELSASQLEALKLKVQIAETQLHAKQLEIASKQKCAKGHKAPAKIHCQRCRARFDCLHPFKVPMVSEVWARNDRVV